MRLIKRAAKSTLPSFLLGFLSTESSHTLAGRGINGMDLVGHLSSLDIPQASGAQPPGFNPPRRVKVPLPGARGPF